MLNYSGDTINGVPNGYGKATFKNGNVYEGEFEDGTMHGQGKMLWPTGESWVGEWDEGYPWNGTEYDAQGKVVAIYEDGEIIMHDE